MKKKTQKQIREEDKIFKEKLVKIRANLVKQNEEYFKLFLKPNDDLINTIDRSTKRCFHTKPITKEELLFLADQRNKRVKEVNFLRLKGGISK